LAIPTGPDKRARKFLRANRVTIDYHLLEQNFEHFAAKCRYGEAFNLQVNDCCPAPFTFVLMWISAIRDVCYSPRRPEVYILDRTIDEVRQNEDISDDSIKSNEYSRFYYRKNPKMQNGNINESLCFDGC
jgi:hypothetical protein